MKRWRDDEGASLVEFALCCAVLFLSLFGAFGLCGALYTYNYVSDAAREATRYAIVRGSSCSGFTTTASDGCNVNQSQIQAYVRGLGYPVVNPNNLTAAVTWSGSNSPANAPGNVVSVTVTYAYPLYIPFWPQSGSVLHMSSKSQLAISQ
ncbi:MAG TPA: TadE/TadG family type IV pilus assembly protein [Acidobacteriaceae bacterium]|nr:TadE/TadG family type IV pilus assembly protein [Acidobacteriaceae bacterium]